MLTCLVQVLAEWWLQKFSVYRAHKRPHGWRSTRPPLYDFEVDPRVDGQQAWSPGRVGMYSYRGEEHWRLRDNNRCCASQWHASWRGHDCVGWFGWPDCNYDPRSSHTAADEGNACQESLLQLCRGEVSYHLTQIQAENDFFKDCTINFNQLRWFQWIPWGILLFHVASIYVLPCSVCHLEWGIECSPQGFASIDWD